MSVFRKLFAPRSLSAGPPPIHIVLVGDSSLSPYPPSGSICGWGQMLPEFFTANARFTNRAKSGRSSRSFREEGSWRKVLRLRPDWVFIQFGHNDQPGKGAYRETDPATTYSVLLRAYIEEARAVGAKVVLVTPQARRLYGSDGRVCADLRPYVEAMRAVAGETQTPFINTFDALAAIFEARGDEASTPLSASREDASHFSTEGARLLADIIATQLFDTVPELRPYLKQEKSPVEIDRA